jgi:hypothetical protein
MVNRASGSELSVWLSRAKQAATPGISSVLLQLHRTPAFRSAIPHRENCPHPKPTTFNTVNQTEFKNTPEGIQA